MAILGKLAKAAILPGFKGWPADNGLPLLVAQPWRATASDRRFAADFRKFCLEYRWLIVARRWHTSFRFKTDLDSRPVDGPDDQKNRPGPIDWGVKIR